MPLTTNIVDICGTDLGALFVDCSTNQTVYGTKTWAGLHYQQLDASMSNTQYGYNALPNGATATGKYNTAVGVKAMFNVTTGVNNTAVGYNALSINTGNNNTAIGSGADVSSAFSFSTAIGANTLATANNQIVMGRSSESVYIPGTASSTSSSTGALTVVGGVGVGGSVNATSFAGSWSTSGYSGVSFQGNYQNLLTDGAGSGATFSTYMYNSNNVQGGSIINWQSAYVNLQGGAFGYLSESRPTHIVLQGNGTGYVGIGKTNPQYTLDVSGTINTNGTIKSPTYQGTWSTCAFTGSTFQGNYYNIITDGGGSGNIFTMSMYNSNNVQGGSVHNGAGGYAYVNLQGTTFGNVAQSRYTHVVLQGTGGSVGIGNTNPQYTLDVSGTTRITTTNYPLTVCDFSNCTLNLQHVGGNSSGQLGASVMFSQSWNNANITNTAHTGAIYGYRTGLDGNFGGGLQFWTNPNNNNDMKQAMVLDCNGVLSVANYITLNNNTIVLSSSSITIPSSGTSSMYINSSGYFTTTSSDRRLKTNISGINYGLKEVLQMNPVSYNWINMEKHGEHREIGFIAQEMKELVPEIITSSNQGGIDVDNQLGINYERLVAVLTKGMQEQQVIIDKLTSFLSAKFPDEFRAN